MPNDELRKRGQAMRRDLLGPDFADDLDHSLYDNDPIMSPLADLAADFIFGGLWSRPGLDLKTRCMVTLISDVATGEDDALTLHLRFARRHGWSESELVEAIIHLTGYIGVPSVRRSLIVAKEVFAKMRAEIDESV